MDISHSGSFVTLEGPEGAGKTTQVKLLAKQLDAIGLKYVLTRDPGGTPLGKQIRRILLNTDSPVEPSFCYIKQTARKTWQRTFYPRSNKGSSSSAIDMSIRPWRIRVMVVE
jgi:thymidylate kinase